MNVYRLIQGDCLEVLPILEDKSINLSIIDPPYNIGIAEWDKIDNYIEWLKLRFLEIERTLKDNGTMWLFHNSFPLLTEIHKMIEKETDFRFRQFITINKGLQSIVGRTSNKLRSFPRATEYLLFYTFEDLTGAKQLSDRYSRVNPMAKYLKEEFDRANVTCKEIAEAGHFYGKVNHGGSVSNWLSGIYLPSKVQYEKIRDYLNGEYLKLDYEDLKQEYEYLKQKYEDLRYTFNLEKGITDVWDVDFYKNIVRNHPTAKPVQLMKRIITATSKKEDVILDPFLGSGSTMVASQHLGRNCIGIENNPKYIELIKKRCFNKTFLDREVEYIFEELKND